VDFADALKRNAIELQSEARTRDREASVISKKVAAVEQEMTEHVDEISRIVTEMGNSFCLLIPKPDQVFGNVDDDDVDEESVVADCSLREHGLFPGNSSITIELSSRKLAEIQRTDDNSPILDNLKELGTLMRNKYLPLTQKWVLIASKASN
jgi:hypothetical protein